MQKWISVGVVSAKQKSSAVRRQREGFWSRSQGVSGSLVSGQRAPEWKAQVLKLRGRAVKHVLESRAAHPDSAYRSERAGGAMVVSAGFSRLFRRRE